MSERRAEGPGGGPNDPTLTGGKGATAVADPAEGLSAWPGALRLDLLLFLFVLLTAGYFWNGWGWNQTARYDAVWAFVEPGPNQGTVRIDDFLVDPEEGVNTGDWARNPEHSEHYYANKAPGTTLLGIPAYAVLYHGERLVGIDPLSIRSVLVNAYLLHLWVTVLPLALSALFFRRLVATLGCSHRTVVGLTVLLYAGTLMLPFSTMMWAHTTAAAFLVMALACFVGPRRAHWVWGGLLAGAAVLTDYGAGVSAVALVVAAALVPRWRDRALWVVAGGVGPLAVFLAYHQVVFGSAFTLASSYSPAEMVSDDYLLGLFGIPRIDALVGLLVSTARGVFVFMPVLVLSVLALRRLRGHPRAAVGWLALANVVVALLVNASFNAWQGGVSAGPRYLIWSLPFWGVLLAYLPWDDARHRRAAWVLGGVSVANMLVIAAVSPMAPDALRGSPLFFAWSKLLGVFAIDLGLQAPPEPGISLSRGSLHVYPITLLRDWDITLLHPLIERLAVFNLGERLLGLRGVASLLPVLVLGGGLGAAASRVAGRLDEEDAVGAD